MLNIQHVRDTLKDIDEAVVTLYLHVDPAHQPNQNTPPAWQIYVKDALRKIEAAMDSADANGLETIKQRIDTFLASYTPSGKTLMLMVGEETQHVHELPIALENRYAFGQPLMTPLVWAIDEYERYLVVLVDQEQAKFFSAYLGHANTTDELSIDFDEYDFRERNYINAGGAQQGSSKDQFEDMRDAHIKRFHKTAAERTREFVDEIDADRIILGGSGKAAHALRDLLHPSLQKRVVDILPIPLDAAEHVVASEIQQAALNYERSHELDLVNEIVNLAKSGGRATLGIEAVRERLVQQQVELLILPWPMDDKDLASELTTQALENGVEVELIHGSAAMQLRRDAEVAARLYYAIPEEA